MPDKKDLLIDDLRKQNEQFTILVSNLQENVSADHKKSSGTVEQELRQQFQAAFFGRLQKASQQEP